MTPDGQSPLGSESDTSEPSDDPDAPAGGPQGWIPPSERPWIHPSELGSAGLGPTGIGVPGLGSSGIGPSGSSSPWLGRAAHRARPGPGGVLAALPRAGRPQYTAGVGVVAAAAIALGVLLLMNAGSGPAPVTLTGASPAAAVNTALPSAVVKGAALATVTVEADGSGPSGCGVVVQGGSLVVTTVAVLAGSSRPVVVTASGRRLSAVVVATDPGSGIALLRVPAALPVAPLGAVATAGSTVAAMAIVDRTGKIRAQWAPATIVSVLAPMPGGMAGIGVSGSALPSMPGEPLVDAQGRVLGILVPQQSEDAFMPMPLVNGIANELDTDGQLRHGWLDVVDTTSPAVPTSVLRVTGSGPDSDAAGVARNTAQQALAEMASTTSFTASSTSTINGALVVSVTPGGAAASALDPGDVIVAVNGSPVRSAPELRSRLYLMPPGQKVTILVIRGARQIRVTVELSASP